MLEPAPPLPPAAPPLDPLIAAAIEAYRKPPPRGFADYVPVLIMFGLVFALGSSLVTAVAVLGVITLRDLVRFGLMKALNAHNPDLLLLPLVKTLPDESAPAWKEGVVVLGGVAIMLVASLAALGVYVATKSPAALSLVYASAAITMLTLLPLHPYDGWRILNLTIFSRSSAVELVVVILTSVGMVLLAIALKAWLLMGFAVVTLIAIPVLNKTAKLVERLARQGFPPPPLSDEAVTELAIAVHQTFVPLQGAKVHLTAKDLALFMRRVSRKLHAAPPGLGGTLALLVGYAASLVYLIAAFVFAAAMKN